MQTFHRMGFLSISKVILASSLIATWCAGTSFAASAPAIDPATEVCRKALKSVLIVDGFFSGRLLAPFLRSQGYAPFHIHSKTTFGQLIESTFSEGDYVADFTTSENPGETVAALQKLNLDAVIPGAETGVALADYLSAKLGLKTNDARLSAARTNKFHMIEELRRAGINVAAQLKTDNLDEVLRWAKEHGRWPIVLKPTMSWGTAGVFICHSEEEIVTAFGEIMGKKNSREVVNDAVLVQAYLPGAEYAVNAVTSNGTHLFTDIWQYNRHEVQGAATIYDEDILLDYDGEVQAQLRAYVVKVLDALRITVGPSHAEVKMTPDGPVLVEIGARLAGANMPQLVDKATGRSPVKMTVDAYLHPEKFLGHGEGYVKTKDAALLFLQPSGLEGRKMSHRQALALKNLPGVVGIDLIDEGTPLLKPRDADTVIGVVEFLDADPGNIEHSMKIIREWERQGLFEK